LAENDIIITDKTDKIQQMAINGNNKIPANAVIDEEKESQILILG